MNEPERNALADASKSVVEAYDACSGAEPSVSVLDRAIDELRAALRTGEAGKQVCMHGKMGGDPRACGMADAEACEFPACSVPPADPSPAAREQQIAQFRRRYEALPQGNINEHGDADSLLIDMFAALTAERAPGAEQPVAWGMIAANTGQMVSVTMDEADIEDLQPEHVVPLFAAPQPDLAATQNERAFRAEAKLGWLLGQLLDAEDVRDGEGGKQLPNFAMSLLTDYKQQFPDHSPSLTQPT